MQLCIYARNISRDLLKESYGRFMRSLWVLYLFPQCLLLVRRKGIQALTNGFNSIYQIQETRNYFATRIRAVFYTLVFIIAIISTLILQVFGNTLQRGIEQAVSFPGADFCYHHQYESGNYISILCLVFLLMYKFIPNRRATFRSQLPGALLCAVCWSAFSFGFSLYVDFNNGFSNMYGSMTTIVLILLWLYFCMMFVMLGAQVNHYFEEKFRWLHQIATETVGRNWNKL